MSKHSTLVAMGCALLTLTVLGTYVSARSSSGTSYVTFSGPVSLPGVSLGSGTYVFERVDSQTDTHLVMVRNRTTSQVVFLGFTLPVSRPARLAEDHQIVFRESPKGVAPRIDAWYPAGESTGAQFMYPAGR
jgi:hypothetical protein